ncbi:uncharacterized protein LOC129238556 [Anastrepha obliqua]|uniref:uncharacterized protein LOC129238556 n=1 Tax=Anastrepha obliqua TaxID=95512 RepID=UPI002409E099|nr:uncharacterized protein LOC129238556 [Anastrepha obliqua]
MRTRHASRLDKGNLIFLLAIFIAQVWSSYLKCFSFIANDLACLMAILIHFGTGAYRERSTFCSKSFWRMKSKKLILCNRKCQTKRETNITNGNKPRSLAGRGSCSQSQTPFESQQQKLSRGRGERKSVLLTSNVQG